MRARRPVASRERSAGRGRSGSTCRSHRPRAASARSSSCRASSDLLEYICAARAILTRSMLLRRCGTQIVPQTNPSTCIWGGCGRKVDEPDEPPMISTTSAAWGFIPVLLPDFAAPPLPWTARGCRRFRAWRPCIGSVRSMATAAYMTSRTTACSSASEHIAPDLLRARWTASSTAWRDESPPIRIAGLFGPMVILVGNLESAGRLTRDVPSMS